MAVRLVVLLRGINVGGHKKVEMSRLRAVIGALGHEDVRTVLQSGNAVFTCSRRGAAGVAEELESAIEAEFGFGCRVIARTAAEWRKAMSADPLLDLMADPSRHFVGFMPGSPDASRVAALAGADYGDDHLAVRGRHLYLWCPNGLSASAFAKLDLDRALGVAVTTRNWNTVTKLADLIDPG